MAVALAPQLFCQDVKRPRSPRRAPRAAVMRTLNADHPTLAQRTVNDLVNQSRAGDAAAFEELIRRYERLALSVAYGVLHDVHLCGDVVQEAFLKAWRRLDALSRGARFAPWLCGIVRNLCVDLKRRKRIAVCGLEEAHGQADVQAEEPAEQMSRSELARQISAALATLDDATRSCIVLRYYDNRSSKEIGELLGVSPAAVDMRLMRGRQTLKESLALSA
jgi:RNA polymerase sigma-70 factor (ECF subfamily)